jgi:PAS domain S-box-containing protein
MFNHPAPRLIKLTDTPEKQLVHSAALPENIPGAIYTCDLQGNITSYNAAAVALWGREPKKGQDKWCGSLRLYGRNGNALPHEASPMAQVIGLGIEVNEGEVIIVERPNRTRTTVRTFPVANFDSEGKLCGGVNSLFPVSILNTEAEEKQALLAAIVNTSDDAIISKDLQGFITSWNSAAERMFGYKPTEVLGKHVSILIPEARAHEEAFIIQNISRGEKIDHIETTRLTKDGREIPISLSVSPIIDFSGKIIGASKIVRDITDKKIAAEKQSILSAIIESSDSAIISKDMNGIITSWNPAAERIFKFSSGEILGKHISILIPPDRIQEEEAILKSISQGQKVDHLETFRLAKDGSQVALSLTVSPIVDSEGKVIGASKIARDITDLKIAEEKQAVLAAIVKTSDDAIISKTLEGIITSWNRAAETMFGYTPEEIIGKHISVLIPTERLEEEKIIITNIAKGQKVDHFETVRLAKDGSEVPLSITVSPLIDSSGKVIGASKIARNISAQQKAQEINNALFQKVKALNEKKDEFIGIASHELKTPLTSISGYLQLLARGNHDSTTKQFIGKTIQQVNKLTTLVSDMLDVSKIEAGKLQFSKKEFDIKLMVENAMEIIGHTHNDHEISLNTNLQSIPIHGDEQRIEQVMINLLSNAIKYSPARAKIEISIEASTKEILVGVKDKGYGIAPDLLKKVFSRFYRVDENPNISGLGIGLYISSQVIERHNGKIWVESELKKGSTFWFTLPRMSH